MRKYFIFIVLLSVFSYNAVAQTLAPEITRIEVEETTGEVILFWTPNADPTDFDHSEVWYQQSYLPGFNPIPNSENTDYTTNYYDHTEAQANNRQTRYYVTNYNTNPDTLQSEVVSAIYLKSCFSGGVLQLEWNKVHPLWTEPYDIYRKAKGSNNWVFFASTTNTTYPILASGYGDYSYKIHQKKNASDATASVSNATSFDQQPITPSIISVVIESGGATAIEWEKSPSTNVVGYIIKKTTSDGEKRDTIHSPDIRYWLDQQTTLSDCEQVRNYAISAMNDCGETSTSHSDSSKNTFVLYAPDYETCNKEVKLRWQPYESNMTVTRYEIYISDNNGNTIVKNSPPTETEYSFTDFQTGQYCFHVSAIHERGAGKDPQTITSCQYCTDVYVPQKPGKCFFRSVSVNENNTIQISFEVDTSAISPKYRIERSKTGDDGSYDVIATLAPTGFPVISFVDADPTLKTPNHSYHYLLYTLDNCDNVYPAEKPAQTILLTATEDKNHHSILEWNDYDGYLFRLDHYDIHRYINGEFDKTFSDILTSYYTDEDILLSDQTLSVDYRIAAISHAIYGTDKNERDTAFSNIAPLKRLRNDIWFPNAFSPSGSNKIFRPVYSGLAVETYEFTIFNRYGAVIYQTVEPGGGWNGKINGITAVSGGYGYMLKIKLKNGDRIERRGSMLLIN